MGPSQPDRLLDPAHRCVVGSKGGDVRRRLVRATAHYHDNFPDLHAMKMLVASCARGAANLRELLELARPYDDAFVTRVIHGLYVFDEHNVSEDAAHVHGLLTALPATTWPPFRIVDDVTRAASTQPAGAGLIVLNLKARRIVQIHNSYAEILRRDRGRIRIEGQPTPTQYWYELPHEWAILP